MLMYFNVQILKLKLKGKFKSTLRLQKLIDLHLFTDCFMHGDFSSIIGEQVICTDDWRDIFTKQSETNADKLPSVIFVHKTLH